MHISFGTSGTVIAACKLLCTHHTSPRGIRMCAGSAVNAAGAQESKLQRLYEISKATCGSGKDINDEAVGQIVSSLGAVTLEELGIEVPTQGSKQDESTQRRTGLVGRLWGRSGREASTSGRMTYLHIHEEEALSIGIFCLPRNSRIPLHNHPGMTVFSRVLYGKLHVRSLDWAEPETSQSDGQRRAKLHADGIIQAGDVASVLHANHGGNLHAFTGKTDCAVLDLFLPPYNRRQGRDCSYYEEIGPLQSDGTILLKPFEPPEDFVIHNKTYRGQRIKATPTKRKNHVPA